MSFTGQQTNSRSLNGVIELTDGVLSIENGSISGLQDLDIDGDLDVEGTITALKIKSTNPPVDDDDLTNKLYVNNQDALKLNLTGGTLTGNLNMNTINKITNLANGVNDNDAVNKSQLNLKADLTYVNTQDALKLNLTGGTLTGDFKILKSGTTPDLTTPFKIEKNNNFVMINPYLEAIAYNSLVQAGDKAIIFADSTSVPFNTTSGLVIAPNIGGVGKGIRIEPTGNLMINASAQINYGLTMNTSQINYLGNGVIGTDAVNKSQLDLKADLTYVNNQDALKADLTYVNNQDALKADLTYVNNQDDLKLNLTGGTLTGLLQVNNVLNLNGGTATDPSADFRTNTYIRFGPAGTNSDWAYLRQIGGNNNIQLALDFHDDGNDGALVLRSIGSISSPDTVNTFFTASPAGVNLHNNPLTNVGTIQRTAWSSEELINTKMYQTFNNGTGIKTISANSNGTGNYVDWITFTYTYKNSNPMTSILVIDVYAPYHLTGSGSDAILVRLVKGTVVLFENSQYYDEAGGGGTRSNCLFPISVVVGTPSTDPTVTFKLQIDNSTDDSLHLCQMVNRARNIVATDSYNIKVSEIKI